MHKLLTLAFALFITLPAIAQEAAPIGKLPSGIYKSDPAHSSLNFKVKHLGLSYYVARFTKFDTTIDFSQGDPTASKISVTVDPASIQTNFPDPAKVDFDKELAGADWLDAAQFPAMTFKSTSLKRTSPTAGVMTGDLMLHGVTKPVTLNVTFVGATLAHPMARKPAMGFSASGTIKRSDFGVSKAVPFVSDDVQIMIETEFQKAD